MTQKLPMANKHVLNQFLSLTCDDSKQEEMLHQKAWTKTRKIKSLLNSFDANKDQDITVDLNNYLGLLDKYPLTREDVYALCIDQNTSLKFIWLATMAWGGLRLSKYNGIAAWNTLNAYLPTLKLIRDGALSRSEAYQELSALKLRKLMQGIDAPFYTKLIFFLGGDRLNGYIFDQWTAKSVKLIFPGSGVRLDNHRPTCALNNHHNYEEYCNLVESLHKITHDKTGANTSIETEALIFSYPDGKWREFVRKSY